MSEVEHVGKRKRSQNRTSSKQKSSHTSKTDEAPIREQSLQSRLEQQPPPPLPSTGVQQHNSSLFGQPNAFAGLAALNSSMQIPGASNSEGTGYNAALPPSPMHQRNLNLPGSAPPSGIIEQVRPYANTTEPGLAQWNTLSVLANAHQVLSSSAFVLGGDLTGNANRVNPMGQDPPSRALSAGMNASNQYLNNHENVCPPEVPSRPADIPSNALQAAPAPPNVEPTRAETCESSEDEGSMSNSGDSDSDCKVEFFKTDSSHFRKTKWFIHAKAFACIGCPFSSHIVDIMSRGAKYQFDKNKRTTVGPELDYDSRDEDDDIRIPALPVGRRLSEKEQMERKKMIFQRHVIEAWKIMKRTFPGFLWDIKKEAMHPDGWNRPWGICTVIKRGIDAARTEDTSSLKKHAYKYLNKHSRSVDPPLTKENAKAERGVRPGLHPASHNSGVQHRHDRARPSSAGHDQWASQPRPKLAVAQPVRCNRTIQHVFQRYTLTLSRSPSTSNAQFTPQRLSVPSPHSSTKPSTATFQVTQLGLDPSQVRHSDSMVLGWSTTSKNSVGVGAEHQPIA
ncbi:hypothetical protein K474DRAFT_1680776 [Panus rudis PR-1116 ss-1]|nr:hypothetical protein K474DRAFT_1680776 [Panus rudis PR-1116 ss-1]